ncbi:MAG: hypothetical protein MI861_29035 [Pirellulales bacterium]|nr:hypothetical protein [Pirellulales bacterium]
MRIQQTDQGDVLVLRRSLGCASIFMLLFGALILSCIFIPAQMRGGEELPWYVGFPIGLALVAGGLYRKTIQLDRSAGRADIFWRVAGMTVRHNSKRLDLFDRVSLDSRIRRGENHQYRVYPTLLSGRSSLPLDEQQNPDLSRKFAEQVSAFLDLPLHDTSGGKLIVREADSFGTSLRQRARQSGQRGPLPRVPKHLMTRIDLSAEPVVTLHVPAAGWSARKCFSTLPTCLMGGFFLWLFHDAIGAKQDLGENLIAAFGLGLGGLLVGGSLAALIVSATGRVLVTASPNQLKIRTVSPLLRRTKTIDVDEVEEVFVRDPQHPSSKRTRTVTADAFSRPGVTIRSHHNTLVFGGHLPKSEQSFLSQFLIAILED